VAEVIIFGKPYVDEGNIRTFDDNANDNEYVWHRDKENREVEILEGQGWQFQYDKTLPFLLEKGLKIKIPKGEYHRLIKGFDTLKIRIVKC